MGLNAGLAPSAVKTAIDLVYKVAFDATVGPGQAKAETPAVFMQKTTDRAAVIHEQFMGPGYFTARAESQDVSQGTIRLFNQKTSSVVNYSRSIDIPRTFFDDDQHDVVQEAIQDMGRKARLTRDRNAMNIYNLAFTTQQSNDGVSVFNNAHTRGDGGSVDNLETGTFTPANLETVFVSLQQQKDQDGTLGGYQPSVLLVPTQLLKEGMEVTKSELKPGSANNDLNYYSYAYPGLQLFFSPFLSAVEGGSDTAWFVLAAQHGFCRWVRQDLVTNMVPWENQRNNAYIYKAEFREVVDTVTYQGSVGSNGTV